MLERSVLFAVLCAALSGWFTILCLSVYAHRSMAHRAVKLGPIPYHVMRFWLWFTTGTSVRRWVAVHRKHHVYTDVEGDPHSPYLFGLHRIFFLGYWYYKRESMNPATIEQYGKDCPDDWLERNLYEKHLNLGLVLMLVADLLIFGVWPGLVAYIVQIIWVSLWAAGVINGIAHAVGYRTWKTQDTSRNIVPVAVLVSGEELHNNHHRWPRSAKFSMKWYEFDIGWTFIRTCAAVGQASDIYVKNRRWRTPELASVSGSEAGELGSVTPAVGMPEALAKAREELAKAHDAIGKLPASARGNASPAEGSLTRSVRDELAKAQEALANMSAKAREEWAKARAKAHEALAKAREELAKAREELAKMGDDARARANEAIARAQEAVAAIPDPT